MCGRFCLCLDSNDIQNSCEMKNQKIGFEKLYNLGRKYSPSYNQSPTDVVPMLVSAKHFNDDAPSSDIVVAEMLWGMIPRWHKGNYKNHGLTTNNCRLEGLTTSKLYNPPLRSGKRCVLVCEGFYEWQTVNPKLKSNERPVYYVHVPQDPKVKLEDRSTFTAESINLMRIAGIFDVWTDENGDSIYSFSIITFESDKTFSWLHHRTPAILETDQQVSDWLDFERVPYEKALSVIKHPKQLVWYQVSNYVNNSRNKLEKCNQPITDAKKSPIKNKIMSAWIMGAKQKKDQESGEPSPKKIKTEPKPEPESPTKK